MRRPVTDLQPLPLPPRILGVIPKLIPAFPAASAAAAWLRVRRLLLAVRVRQRLWTAG